MLNDSKISKQFLKESPGAQENNHGNRQRDFMEYKGQRNIQRMNGRWYL